MGLCDQGTSVPVGSGDNYDANRGTASLPHNTVDLSRSKCFGDRPVIQMYQGQPVKLTIWVTDRNGAAVDLSGGSFTPKFVAKDREVSNQPLFTLTGTIEDAAEGKVAFTMTKAKAARAGIFVSQTIIYDSNDNIVWVTPSWLAINPTLSLTSKGPITIPEIRLMLRDQCPDQNFLLDDYEFDDSQIVACMRWPLDEFNEKYGVKTNYTPRTFPFRFHWMRATCGYLMEIAAKGYARDHLPYQAGGVSVDDKNKASVYTQLAQQLLLEWRQFIKERKIEMNIEGGYGRLGSYYGYWNY